MIAERWKRVETVFEQALATPAAKRTAFLEETCDGDDEMRAEIESLLNAHGEAGDFLDNPDLFFSSDGFPENGATLAPDETIDRYRIIREIGRGGMGTVFLAERADDQYQKQVAIKLIKRGMDTDTVLRHFRNERQILAGFDHPNIARLLDGGTTESGLPFFVMEYIEGLPIDEYCTAHALLVAQRLKLFREVCAAVSYAHRHLVIHRDIKRSNILVTSDGVPKLLDFGIAKILQQDDEAKALATMTGLRPMTPQYASPEQLRGEPMTTASDVYSLGVVLYELLCGNLPYRFPIDSPHEMARVIAEVEPKKPSTAVSFTANQKSEIRDQKLLRGDLDNIALMALRKEPKRRYQSVEQFSEDIRRHLEQRPIIARKDTIDYRTSKFVRRNKMPLAAAALLLVFLVGGIIATSWQAQRARTQEAVAQAEKARAERRFNDVRKLAHSVLFEYHDAIKDLAGSTPVRARLVRDALEYLDRLASEVQGDASLQRELASAYERVGDVQGGTLFANLGNTAGAIESYRKSLGLREALLRTSPKDAGTRQDVALNYRKLGLLVWETGNVAGGLEDNRKALALLESLAAEQPENFDLQMEVERSCDYTGMILQEQGNAPGALEQYRRAQAIIGSFPEAQRNSERIRRQLATSYEHTGTALLLLGDLENALEQNRKALTTRAALSAEFPLNADSRRTLSVSYYNDGEILAKMGRDGEALDSYRKDLAIVEELAAADPQNNQYNDDRAYAVIRVGDMLARLGDFPRALVSYRQCLDLRAADAKADPSNLWKRAAVIEAHAKTAKTLAKAGERDAALAKVRETISLMEHTSIEPTNAQIRSAFADTYVDLGDAASSLGQGSEASGSERSTACDMYRRGLEILEDMRKRGILSAGDASKPATVARELTRCDSVRRD